MLLYTIYIYIYIPDLLGRRTPYRSVPVETYRVTLVYKTNNKYHHKEIIQIGQEHMFILFNCLSSFFK